MTDLYAVMGNPIGHSKSPKIHTEFARQCDQDLLYSAMLVPLEGFNDAADDFFRRGGQGLNITVPFKLDAFAYADELSERAQRAGAVNTFKRLDDGRILADNTDGIGMVHDIVVNNDVSLKGKRILVLGAGGAVRGVLQPLLKQQPAELVIANRTVSKAEQLAADFSDIAADIAGSCAIRGCGFDQAFDQQPGAFDLIVNGTSASLAGDLPPVPEQVIGAQTVCYDMMYSAQATVFNQWAEELGAAKTIDGLGMLVEQAAAAFELWRGVRPDTAEVMTQLRSDRRG